jgi:CRP-like cAMP-binding protein
MDELLQTIQPHATTRFIKKGSVLLYQSEIPRSAFIVRKGLIRAYTITSSGEERIVSLHAKGDIFPLSWIYGETPNTLFYYEAASDTEVACIPKANLVDAVMTKPALLATVLKFTINEYTALLLRVTALEQSSAAEKIALTLYYLIIRHGVERKPGLFTIDIKMTQSMIASLVGLTRESTAINLKLLQKKEIITYTHFTYTVNKSNLERFVGEDSFKDLELR